jgi:hypothetical protein
MSTQLTTEPSKAIEPLIERTNVGGVTILNARRELVVVHTDDPRITRALLSETYDGPNTPKRWCGLTWIGWMGVGGLFGITLVVLALVLRR